MKIEVLVERTLLTYSVNIQGLLVRSGENTEVLTRRVMDLDPGDARAINLPGMIAVYIKILDDERLIKKSKKTELSTGRRFRA